MTDKQLSTSAMRLPFAYSSFGPNSSISSHQRSTQLVVKFVNVIFFLICVDNDHIPKENVLVFFSVLTIERSSCSVVV